MISHAEVVARVAEWQQSHAVIEKDYVLGWLLWGIESDPRLQDWVFKGAVELAGYEPDGVVPQQQSSAVGPSAISFR